MDRLKNELEIILSNTDKIRDYSLLLDKNIDIIKGEIADMRECNMKANQEIASGKHFNEWMRLNLKPELKSLGLDAEKTGFQDLMNKLNQNVAAPPHVQEEALEIEC